MRGKLLMRRTEEENKCIKKQEEKEKRQKWEKEAAAAIQLPTPEIQRLESEPQAAARWQNKQHMPIKEIFRCNLKTSIVWKDQTDKSKIVHTNSVEKHDCKTGMLLEGRASKSKSPK